MNLLREYIKKTIIKEMPTKNRNFSINGILLNLEIAQTPEQIQQGLMFRDSLEENCGMIFIFNDKKQRSFWMKNTKIPLSIAYTDASGKIINIEDMHPYSNRQTLSLGPATCAIEMNQGWFQKNGIMPGHTIKGL